MQKRLVHKLVAYILVLCMVAASCIGIAPEFAYATEESNTQDSGITDNTGGITEYKWEQDPVSGTYYYYEIVVISGVEDSKIKFTKENHPKPVKIVRMPYDDNSNPTDERVYVFDENGVATEFNGIFTTADGGDNKYYLNGVIPTGFFQESNGKLYNNGTPYTGEYNSYYYDNGVRYTGVYKSYYYEKGKKVTKYKSVVKKMGNGKIYYFTSDKKVYTGTGWKRINGKRYYFQKGTAVTGWKYIGSYKYYFHGSGTLCQDLVDNHYGRKWLIKQKVYIKVNRKMNCVTLYVQDGNKGYTIPVKTMACSVGKSKTPTIKGTYTLKKSRTYRWHTLGGPSMGGYCYGQWCTRINGGYLFHSVQYRQKYNNRSLYAREYNKLGSAASHGCIRLRSGDAKLIYDIVRNRNTKVTIYDSSTAGPFDKPKYKKISVTKRTDPTDPTVKK